MGEAEEMAGCMHQDAAEHKRERTECGGGGAWMGRPERGHDEEIEVRSQVGCVLYGPENCAAPCAASIHADERRAAGLHADWYPDAHDGAEFSLSLGHGLFGLFVFLKEASDAGAIPGMDVDCRAVDIVIVLDEANPAVLGWRGLGCLFRGFDHCNGPFPGL